MPYPAVFLIHQCTVVQRRTDGTKDAYGDSVYTETELPARACRFGSCTAAPEAGGFLISARCTLAATEDVQAEDCIRTTAAGFAGTYWVNAVRQIYEAVGGRISHTILELRDTEYKEAA